MWRRLFRRGRQKSIQCTQFRPSVEGLEERNLLATLSWAGPNGGLWSVAANWSPAQVPQGGDTVVFGDTDGQNTNSTDDGISAVAGLAIDSSYTHTITLNVPLSVNVFSMWGGTLTGGSNTNLSIIDAQPTDTSFFAGGTLSVDTNTFGGPANHVRLFLAGDFSLQPDLEANLTTDAFTDVHWERGNMTVGTGKTILNNGTFLADSVVADGTAGTISTPLGAGNWAFTNTGTLTMGEGVFQHVIPWNHGGQLQKVASMHQGTDLTFVLDGSLTQDNGGTTDVGVGTLVVTGGFVQVSGGTSIETAVFSVHSFEQDSGTTNLYLSAGLVSTTTVMVTGGTFSLSGAGVQAGGIFDVVVPATLTATGPCSIAASTVYNDGTFTLGTDTTVGTLSIVGDYVQSWNQSWSSILNMMLMSGSTYSQLNVSGVASLNGVLNVYDIGGFLPYPGMIFELVTYSYRYGIFTVVNLPPVAYGYWVWYYDDGGNPPNFQADVLGPGPHHP
jgi:hypothetical protein